MLPKKGDLVHLPANTYLFKIRLEDNCIKKFIKSGEEPRMCLLAEHGQDNKYYKIMLDNDYWFVRKTDAFLNI